MADTAETHTRDTPVAEIGAPAPPVAARRQDRSPRGPSEVPARIPGVEGFRPPNQGRRTSPARSA